MSFWARALKSSAENGIPKKFMDASTVSESRRNAVS